MYMMSLNDKSSPFNHLQSVESVSFKCYQGADWSDSRWRGKPNLWGCHSWCGWSADLDLGCGQVDQASASLTHCLPENSWPKWHHVIDLMFDITWDFGSRFLWHLFRIFPEVTTQCCCITSVDRNFETNLVSPKLSFSPSSTYGSPTESERPENADENTNLIQHFGIVPLKRVQVQYKHTNKHKTKQTADWRNARAPPTQQPSQINIAIPSLAVPVCWNLLCLTTFAFGILRRHQWRGSHKNV